MIATLVMTVSPRTVVLFGQIEMTWAAAVLVGSLSSAGAGLITWCVRKLTRELRALNHIMDQVPILSQRVAHLEGGQAEILRHIDSSNTPPKGVPIT